MSYALSAIGAHTMQREGPRKCVQRDSESETYHVGVSPGMIDVVARLAQLSSCLGVNSGFCILFL